MCVDRLAQTPVLLADLQELVQQCASVEHDPTFCLMLAFPRSLGLDLGACELRNHEQLMWISCDSSKPVRPLACALHNIEALMTCTSHICAMPRPTPLPVTRHCLHLDGAVQGRSRQDGHECWTALATPAFARRILADRPLVKDGNYNKQNKAYLDGITPTMQLHFVDAMKAIGSDSIPKPSFAAVQRWGAGFLSKPLHKPFLAAPGSRLVACGDFCLGSTAENAMQSGLAAADMIREWCK
jgi:predicted NAD/FAD-dependent oxidoreductase